LETINVDEYSFSSTWPLLALRATRW